MTSLPVLLCIPSDCVYSLIAGILWDNNPTLHAPWNFYTNSFSDLVVVF